MVKVREETEEKRESGTARTRVLRFRRRPGPWIAAAAILLAAVVLIVVLAVPEREPPEPEIDSISNLQRIIAVSNLSTYKVVYNGVAAVPNEKKPDKIDCYVAYESTVEAGIDFTKIGRPVIDEESKTVVVTLPPVEIMEPNLGTDIDYIIINKKADRAELYSRYYSIAKEDALQESTRQTAIIEMAAENAKNVVKALIEPIMPEYEIIVEVEAGK